METQSLLYVGLDVGYLEPDKFRKPYRMAEETASLIERIHVVSSCGS
jgi:hypothetical protein